MKKFILVIAITVLVGCSALEKLANFGVEVKTPFFNIGISTVESNQ